MYSNDVSHIIGRAEETKSAPQKKNSALDKDSFLRLLVTQLEHQDPLQPKADTEFVAQLAQFSSLEQLTNISKGVGNIEGGFGRQDIFTAVNFLGKEVLAAGTDVSKEDDRVSSMLYALEDTAVNAYANIFDPNGNLVRTVHMGPRQPGQYEFAWDGKNHAGQTMQNGVYSVFFAAEGINGEPVMVDTKVSGLVSGVNSSDGRAVLRLKDGREVDLTDVTEIINPQSQSEQPQEG
ncbi:MAG: flagellar hook assembly protein FlgD [Desulfovibrionales bacterium]